MRSDGRSPAHPFGWLEFAFGLGLVLAVGALYAQTALHQFVSFDDNSYLTENPHVAGGLTLANARWAFLAFHSGNWHPLTWLSHQLDVTLFGLTPGPHHLVSAGLHALNAVLLFVFFRRASGRLGPSVLVALFFALHPLRAESVAWAAERKDVLAGAFFALTLLAYERHARAPSRASLVRVGLLFALGLLAKPMLVTLPALLLVLDFWPLCRATGGGTPRALVLEKLPLAGLALLSALVTLVAQQAAGAVQSIESLTLVERLAAAVRAPLAYLELTLVPRGLAVFYPHPALVPGSSFAALGPRTWLALLLLIGVTLLSWRLRRRLPMLLAGWVWFALMLLPVAGLVQVGSQLHADRYTYLPMIGPVFALVFALDAVLAPRLRRPAFALGLLASGLLAGLAWRQIATWKDSRTLCEQALRATDRNYMAHEHLGLWHQGHGELARAEEHYRVALAIYPNLPGAMGNLAVLQTGLGRTAEARQGFEALLALHPGNPQALLGLASLALRANQPAEVLALLESFPEDEPAYAIAQINLAAAHEALGDWKQTLASYERAFATGSPDPESACAAAWILATGPDPEVLDGERALELATFAVQHGVENAPVVQAAAHARRGDTARAVAVLEAVHQQNLAPMQRRLLDEQLRLYRAGEPYTRTR